MRASRSSGITGLLIVVELLAVAFMLGIVWVRLDLNMTYAYVVVMVPTAGVVACGLVVGYRVVRKRVGARRGRGSGP